jgi:membrane protein implicated in regulation of membrane protease activity
MVYLIFKEPRVAGIFVLAGGILLLVVGLSWTLLVGAVGLVLIGCGALTTWLGWRLRRDHPREPAEQQPLEDE